MNESVIQNIQERVITSIKAHNSVGIQVPEGRHDDLLESIIGCMQSNPQDQWTILACHNTYETYINNHPQLLECPHLHFIDCISRYSGITQPNTTAVTYIDSPTMLEHLLLSMISTFKNNDPNAERFFFIDSLSALTLHNNTELITKFTALMLNRARNEHIHVASVIIEEETHGNNLLQLNDKIIVLRDSFIG